jgi:hypothetical protein
MGPSQTGPRIAWSVSILAVVAILGSSALAADPPKKPPESAAKTGDQANAKEKLECSYTEVAGTLMRKRVCFTQAQLKAQREANEDLVRERRELGGGAYPERNISSLSPSGTLNGR